MQTGFVDEKNLMFVVIGRNRDGQAFLCTRRTFATRTEAEIYRQTINACYWPEVVESLPLKVVRVYWEE